VNQSASSQDLEILRSDIGSSVDTPAEYERAVEHVVDECFLATGQAVGMRMTVDYDAVLFLRDHYRAKFLAAMKAFGNRWAQDRQNVTSVAMLFGERAVRYAEGRESIDLDSVRKAAADVERYCKLHSRRAARASGYTEGGVARIAGYWCTDDNP
jgi:hypothetical protein